jgi:hypothetical protein
MDNQVWKILPIMSLLLEICGTCCFLIWWMGLPSFLGSLLRILTRFTKNPYIWASHILKFPPSNANTLGFVFNVWVLMGSIFQLYLCAHILIRWNNLWIPDCESVIMKPLVNVLLSFHSSKWLALENRNWQQLEIFILVWVKVNDNYRMLEVNEKNCWINQQRSSTTQ